MNWQELSTVEDLWEHCPRHIRALFSALNTEDPVLSRLTAGDTIGGAKLLLEHYKQVDRQWILTTLEAPPTEEAVSLADGLLSDSVFLQGHMASVPLTNDGGWQWNFTGPEKDDEFGYSLNGHKYLSALLVAAEKTAQSNYVGKIDRIVKDWIIHHPLPYMCATATG